MARKAAPPALDDSDSLSSLGGSSDEKETGTRSSTTSASTPATSVVGDDRKGKNSRRSTLLRSSTRAGSTAAASAMDEASEDEAVGARLKADTEAQSSSSRAIPKKVETPTSRAGSTSARSSVATGSGAGRKRPPSPEVVIYTSSRSASASSSSSKPGPAASVCPAGRKRPRSSLATSSPVSKADLEDDEDPDATEDDEAFVKKSRKLTKRKVESEDDDFELSAVESEANDTGSENEEITTASKLLAKQITDKVTAKLASSPSISKGKGKAPAADSTSNHVVSASGRKSLEKLKKSFADKKTTTAPKYTKKSLDKLKKAVVTGSSGAKGKGKKIASSDEEGDSDFVVKAGSDEESDELSNADGSDLSDVSDEEEGVTTTSGAARIRTRRTRGKRVDRGKRLTWWEKNDIALQEHHPELRSVWDDLRLVDVVKPTQAEQPEGLTMKLLPFQREGLYWMEQQEKGPWRGGLLADEMGMGKTIQMISLILSDHLSNASALEKRHTLVMAPTVAIMQWRNEFNKFTSGLKVCVWHGGNRITDSKELLKYDVVLTSYAVLESSFRRQNTGFKRKGELLKEESVLHSIDWHRVILDEAHNIKDRSCNTARGAFALKAAYRWCLSGTPLQNRVGELYSLIRFIGVDPFAFYYCKRCPCRSLHWKFSNKRTCDECGHTPMHHICYWNNEILKPIQKYGALPGTVGAGAFEKLSLLLARMMLRRTKVERADDMGLPPRAMSVRRDYFTEEEEEFYTSLYSDVKRQFSTYVAQDSLLNNYANVFQLLTRMRQTACHPDMVLKGAAAKALLGEGAGASAMSISTCRLCLDEGEDPIMSKCRHVYCRECIRQYLETAIEIEPECPVCHLPLTIDLSQETDQELIDARQGMLSKIDPGKWRTSTKIEALVEELSQLKTEDHSIKSLVFSQFTSFLDLIARRLQLAGFKIARLQGNMSPEARDRTVKYFMNTTDCTVFLLSLKAGGVALNLTEASRVFIMDPWWNPAAELQAADRIHRIGQHRPVIVKRLVIENSIESKIVELQKKKEHMTGAALGDDDQALGRLTPEDLSFLFVM